MVGMTVSLQMPRAAGLPGVVHHFPKNKTVIPLRFEAGGFFCADKEQAIACVQSDAVKTLGVWIAYNRSRKNNPTLPNFIFFLPRILWV